MAKVSGTPAGTHIQVPPGNPTEVKCYTPSEVHLSVACPVPVSPKKESAVPCCPVTSPRTVESSPVVEVPPVSPAVPSTPWELPLKLVTEICSAVGPLTSIYCPTPPTGTPADCVRIAPSGFDFSTYNFAGKNTFVNIPFAALPRVLEQYLQQKALSPSTTSAVFVVPEWSNRRWFASFAPFLTLQRIPKGSSLLSMPVDGLKNVRRSRGPSPWATLVLWDPPSGKSERVASAESKLSGHKGAPSEAVFRPGVRTWDTWRTVLTSATKLLSAFLILCSTVIGCLVGFTHSCVTQVLKVLGSNGRVLHLRCQFSGITAVALVDSGASRSFVSSKFARQLGHKPVVTSQPLQITLADKRVVDSSLCLPRVKMKFQGVQSWATLYVLDDLDDDVILGMDWLEHVNPKIDWVNKTMKIGNSVVYCQLSQQTRPTGSPPDYLVSKKQLKRMVAQGLEPQLVMLRSLNDRSVSSVSFASLSPDRCPPHLQNLLSQYVDVFDKPKGLPPSRPIKHTIPLDPAAPTPSRMPYRMSPRDLEELKRQLTELVEMGFIRPSSSAFASPVLLVPKPNGTWRLCVDYRALNLATVKSKYPLPRLDDLFHQLHGARYFSKLDFTSGYWQIEMEPSDVHKTAFTTRYGLFEWLVMPFGLTAAPSTFQRAMNSLFHDLLDQGVVVYLDDVLIYAKTLEEHNALLEQVLQRLREQKYYASLDKCYFAQEEVSFLGHRLTAKGIQPLHDRVEAVRDWPTPTTVQDVRSFLGLCSFYRKFIKRFAHIAGPLHDLTKGNPKKRASVVWTDACERAFQDLKSALCEAPVLKLPDPSKPFIIHTDASDFAIGAVLMQEFDTGLHPVEFFSRRLRGPELRYDARVREMLTIREMCRHWNHLIAGCHTDIYSDHESLKSFFTQKELNKRDYRWIDELQALDITIHYQQGQINVVADALSRRPDYLSVLSASSPSLHSLAKNLRAATSRDPALTALATTPGYSLEDGLLFQVKGDARRIVVPSDPALRRLVLAECHEACAHGGMHKTLATATRHFTWRGMASDVKRFVKSCHTCQTSKPSLVKPAGLLRPLPVPSNKFHTIGIDQIVALPQSRDGFDSVLTVTDHLTKYVILVPCKESDDAESLSHRLFDKVVSLFGLPVTIVSDRDPKYTSRFWKSLFRSLGTKLHVSTAYHPQTDGASERTNQTVEVMLRCVCSDYGADWAEKLPRVQFALNTSVSESTQFSPAQLLMGYQPRNVLDVFAQSSQPPSDNPAAADMLEHMRSDLDLAHKRLADAKARMKAYADKSRRDVCFEVGDEVLLSTANIDFAVARKLKPRFVGPFKVTKVISPVAYQIALPKRLEKLHPVFHVSLLKKYIKGFGHPATPPPPLAATSEYERFEVQAIIGHRLQRGRLQYHVLWKGYPLHEATWEPEANLDQCRVLLRAYKQMHRL